MIGENPQVIVTAGLVAEAEDAVVRYPSTRQVDLDDEGQVRRIVEEAIEYERRW